MKNTSFIIFLMIMASFVNAQDLYPKEDFRSPLDIPLYLSGTFGEPRRTHFHAGLDIKTQGVEGKNIYAIGDGYISRIKVSAFGYGNTIYITHTNGYTSVYAHLREFNNTITKWVEIQQNNLTKFEVDLDSLDANLFIVQKSDVIAKSGNTGGSHGPHLHFEIRDELERPINPFLFGFDFRVEDNVKPGLYNIVLYNLTSGKQFSNSKTVEIKSNKSGNTTIPNVFKVNKDVIGFGINTTDKLTDVRNHNGVYDIKMFVDGELLYHYQMNRFSFDNARDVLTHCDYWMKRNKNQSVHKCFVEQGNKLETYNYLINNGYVYLYDYLTHNVKIEVSDFHRNISIINFKVQRDDNSNMFLEKEISFHNILMQGKQNKYKNKNIEITMPEGTLYEDFYFNVKEKAKSKLSNSFEIGDVKIPVFSKFNVELKINTIAESLKDKYLIAYKNYKGYTKALGSEFDENTNIISAETRAFGEYFVTVDTIAPKIKSLSVVEGKTMTKYTKFQFKITDNLSGLEEYNCFVNGKWVILVHDAKKHLFTYTVDDNIIKGKNNITVIAKDERNNASTFNAEFVY